jgi:hypothetical protein
MPCEFKKIDNLTWRSIWRWNDKRDAEKFKNMLKKKEYFNKANIKVTTSPVVNDFYLVVEFSNIEYEAEFILSAM